MLHIALAAVACCFAVARSALADPAANVPAPVIALRTFDLAGYANVQAAIDAAAGGGTICVGVEPHDTGPLTLANGVDLHLDAGALLRLTDDPAAYAGRRGCIVAAGCHDVSITGEGTIDGRGQRWWDAVRRVKGGDGSAAVRRPYLVVFDRCQRVLVRGVTLADSPKFHLVPRSCTDVAVDRVTIRAPADAPNTDGLDPSGWHYRITGCTFDVGDDCSAIKPSQAQAGGRPSCEDIAVTDCTFRHGLSVGGQTPGGLWDLRVSHCTFDGTDAGIRLKAGRGTGGVVEDSSYDDLTMRHVKMPVFITSYYPKPPADPAADPARPVTPQTPLWRHIRISRLSVTDSPEAGRIMGLPEQPVADVTFTACRWATRKGMTIVSATGVRFVASKIDVLTDPTLLRGGVADVIGLP